MDQDGIPGLAVGFRIEFGGSLEELTRLQQFMSTTEFQAIASANKIEGSFNKLSFGTATANMRSFVSESTAYTRETNRMEKSAEAHVRQLTRQAEAFGKTKSELREMQAAALDERGLTELATRLRAASARMDELHASQVRATGSTGNARQAMAGASYQVQDFITQVSMGANPINAFAVQGAQLAGQFSSVEGAAGNVARFFMGPWGLALTAGVMVLAPFLGKLMQTNDELQEAFDKLVKDADATKVAEQAKERYSRTLRGVVEAIEAQIEASKRSKDSAYDAAAAANNEAIANARVVLQVREKTAAYLEAVRAQLAADKADTTSPDINRQFRIQQAQKMLPEIEEKLARANLAIAKAQQALTGTSTALADEQAKLMVDKVAQIKQRYEGAGGLLDIARRDATQQERVNGLLASRLALLRTQEAQEIAAEQRRQSRLRSATNDNRQSGRAIGLSDAEAIVRSIGGVITSTTRSFDEQRVLYERYLAGKGPLAAKPGTSDHEVGGALDVRKTAGMSLAKIRAAFAAQGVAVKQLLDEGTHFHVAWKRGADEAAKASRNLADTQADLAKKFDPAASAARDLRQELAAIAAAKLDPATAARYADAAKAAFAKARASAFTLPSIAEIGVSVDEEEKRAKSNADFEANVLAPLRNELALYGQLGPERELAALGLEKQAFVARNMDQGLAVALERWQAYYDLKRKLIEQDASTSADSDAIRAQIDFVDELARSVQNGANGMADAFGAVGRAIGDMAAIYAGYHADRERLDADHMARLRRFAGNEQALNRENAKYAIAASNAQIGAFGDMTVAAKGFFDEKSKGYKALAVAEKVFRAVEFAMSVRAMAQDIAETFSSVANSGARAAAAGAEGVANQSRLPFPANIAAMAATGAALIAAGISIAGGFSSSGNTLPKSNEGRGTVLGDADAQSESIRRAIDGLKDIDTLMLSASRDMAASLRSIDTQIGGVASLVVRAGNVNADAGVAQGFKANAIGSILGNVPLIGGFLKSLFGSTTSVIGSGLYGDAQSLGSILNGGFDAQYYSDIEKKKKFLGITTGKSYSTQYTGADANLEDQFTLILRSFNDAIRAAAGPLDVATTDIEQRLAGFVVNIGKIDTKGLTGEQIEEKLAAVFGAAADGMAAAAIPGIERFQQVGEGAFETLVRVASTVETVTASLDQMRGATRALGIDAKLGIAGQFDTVRDFTSAADAYIDRFYSDAEKNAAMVARFGKVFVSMGLAMPDTLAGFRALVEAQDLTTEAGQSTYATLLKLAPAFADLKGAMEGAKSAADILAERQDLERKLLEVRGDTAAVRALDLAKLDASNRQLQEQIWAIEAANQAAEDAKRLAEAWGSVGDSIMNEVRRIRGLTGTTEGGGFASLLGRFNTVTVSARGGDQDAAKLLPGLSQELLRAAEQSATSRQELTRVQGQTATSLEETFAAISKLAGTTTAATSTQGLLDAMASQRTASAATAANDSMADELRELRAELAAFRADNNAGHAATAANTGATKRMLENVTNESGGDAIATIAA